jgi:RNA polymerase sigma-70 factor (ECF subfamily)
MTLMSMDTSAGMASGTASLLQDTEIVRRVRNGEHALFEILMRRHNQRVYRAARAVVKEESEAEDVMQQAYINAFMHLDQFEERAQFSTWLTRIALNEAFARRKKMRIDNEELMDTHESPLADPERLAYGQELNRVLEEAVDALPESYRTVFMLREIEGLSTSETGAGLGIGEEAVKTRLHRARAMVRRAVTTRIGASTAAAFQFPAVRCDRVVLAVMRKVLGP